MLNHEHLTSAAPDHAQAPPIEDTVRLPIEAKSGNKRKMVIAGIVAFVLFLALCFVLVTYAKNKLKAFNDQRAIAAAEKKAKGANSASSRKAIDFGSMLPPASSPAPATVPGGAQDGLPGDGPVGTVRGGASPAPAANPGATTPHAAAPKPSMMIDVIDRDAVPAAATAASTSVPKPMTQEELLALINQSKGGGSAPALAPEAASVPGQASNAARPAKTVQQIAERSKNSKLTNTKQVSAADLGDTRYVLTRGHHIPCVLESQIMSNLPGTTGCIVSENIYSTDGKVLLLEKGTRAVGEYETGMKPGDSRLAILWDRLETPTGVIVDLDSPSADSVGASGVTGYVDNHWFDRIGAAFLLSYVQDVIQYKTTQATPPGTATTPTYTNSTNTATSMTDKVLNSTINIPPTMLKNRGDLITIEVRHDLWFQDVYAVK
jgi:type IV secretion system protein VirB10